MGASYTVSVRRIGASDEIQRRKNLAVLHACEEAGVNPPKEILKYFDDNPKGEELIANVEYSDIYNEAKSYCTKEDVEDGNRIVIDLKKIPKDITHIVVEVSC